MGGRWLYSYCSVQYMCFKQKGVISTQSGKPLKFADQFTYFGSNISSNESDVNIRLAKVSNAIDRLSIIWKSDLSDNIYIYNLYSTLQSSRDIDAVSSQPKYIYIYIYIIKNKTTPIESW